MKFVPCNGKCTETGAYCDGCGRSREEVAETRKMVGGLVVFAQKMNYENPEDFAQFIHHSILYKLAKA